MSTIEPSTPGEHHRMERMESRYPGQHLYVCPQCERRVVLDHGALTVLERGDLSATHSGGNVAMAVTVSAGGQL